MERLDKFKTLLGVLDERGISRHKLATLSRIQPSDLYAALAGKRPMYDGWKSRISEALGVSVSELFPDQEETPE